MSRVIWLFFLAILFIANTMYGQYDAGIAVQPAPTPTVVIDAHCYSIGGEVRCADKLIDAPRWNSIYQGPFVSGTPMTPTPAIPPTPTVGVGTPTPVKPSWCYCCARGPQPNSGRVLVRIGPGLWGSEGIYLGDGDCVRYSAPATSDCGDLFVVRQNASDYLRCDVQ